MDGALYKPIFTITATSQELYSGFDALKVERENIDRQILAWSQHLAPEWLSRQFEYTSNVDGKRRILPTWILVTHMFNHQTHHRGQVTTLLKQQGYDPGVIDVPWLPSLNAVV